MPVSARAFKTLPSEEQKEILKGLSERADKVRNRVVEPDEDNMLKITNDGKKLAPDQRHATRQSANFSTLFLVTICSTLTG